MNIAQLAEHRIDRLVEDLFRQNPPPRYGDYCINPVTGGSYLHGDDPIEPQKAEARRRLLAREWFAINGPADAQPLPISHNEREDLKAGGLPHILAWYARSLDGRDYNVEEHPSFDDYACGVMASKVAPDFIKTEELQKRFPPRALAGLDPSLYWRPPEDHTRYMAIHWPQLCPFCLTQLRQDYIPMRERMRRVDGY